MSAQQGLVAHVVEQLLGGRGRSRGRGMGAGRQGKRQLHDTTLSLLHQAFGGGPRLGFDLAYPLNVEGAAVLVHLVVPVGKGPVDCMPGGVRAQGSLQACLPMHAPPKAPRLRHSYLWG